MTSASSYTQLFIAHGTSSAPSTWDIDNVISTSSLNSPKDVGFTTYGLPAPPLTDRGWTLIARRISGCFDLGNELRWLEMYD